MLTEKRQALLQRQYQLVALLTLPGQNQTEQLGMNPQRVRLVAKGLAIKRSREALACWPALTEALGPQGPQLFREFAYNHKRPAGGCPRLDGFNFAQWLVKHPCQIPLAQGLAERVVTEFAVRRGKVRPANLLVRHYRKLRYKLLGRAALGTNREFHALTVRYVPEGVEPGVKTSAAPLSLFSRISK